MLLLLLLFVAASAPLTTRSAPPPPPLSEHMIRAPADVSILSAQWAHYAYRRNFRLGRRVNRPIGPARIGPFRAGGRAPMLICALGRRPPARPPSRRASDGRPKLIGSRAAPSSPRCAPRPLRRASADPNPTARSLALADTICAPPHTCPKTDRRRRRRQVRATLLAPLTALRCRMVIFTFAGAVASPNDRPSQTFGCQRHASKLKCAQQWRR